MSTTTHINALSATSLVPSEPSCLHYLWSDPKMINPTDISLVKPKWRYRWMRRMAPYPLNWDDIYAPSGEHLFQWLRFSGHETIQKAILAEPSPYRCQKIARAYQDSLNQTGKWDEGQEDIENMRKVLLEMVAQHPELALKLKETGKAVLVEDCTDLDLESAWFWGAVQISGNWHGHNVRGCLWMEVRDGLWF